MLRKTKFGQENSKYTSPERSQCFRQAQSYYTLSLWVYDLVEERISARGGCARGAIGEVIIMHYLFFLSLRNMSYNIKMNDRILETALAGDDAWLRN